MKEGISKEQIIRINLEDYKFNTIQNYADLFEYVNSKLIKEKMNYVIIDEVRKITDFQKACDSLYIKKNVDLCIIGSNSRYLLTADYTPYTSYNGMKQINIFE